MGLMWPSHLYTSLWSELSASQWGASGRSCKFLCLSPVPGFVSVLLYHISHWVLGLTEIETPVRVEVSEVEPDLVS
jgi:hypothetical protein